MALASLRASGAASPAAAAAGPSRGTASVSAAAPVPGAPAQLRIDGCLHGGLVSSARMSADTARDRLGLTVDDTSIQADGSDMTRLTFRALDAYGHQRPHVTGDVTLTLHGPATLISENPFSFAAFGGVGGAFVRSQPGRTGLVSVTAQHRTLGHATAQLTVTRAGGRDFL